jgi:hypothetical protein
LTVAPEKTVSRPKLPACFLVSIRLGEDLGFLPKSSPKKIVLTAKHAKYTKRKRLSRIWRISRFHLFSILAWFMKEHIFRGFH